MRTVLYVIFTLCHMALTVWGVRLFRRSKSVGAFTLLLPIAALIYDNGIVALGATLGEGALLKTLSYPRFAGHAFLTPVWIVTSVAFARRSGADWFARRPVRIGAWVMYVGMVVLGVIDALVLLELVPEWDGSIFYYTNAGGLPGPPFPAIIMVVVTVIASVFVLRNLRWPWMLVGALFMFVAAGIPSDMVGFFVSNAGEVVLGLAMVATEFQLQKRNDIRTSLQ